MFRVAWYLSDGGAWAVLGGMLLSFCLYSYFQSSDPPVLAAVLVAVLAAVYVPYVIPPINEIV